MTWQDAQLQLAESLPGYEARPEQTRLAENIEKAFANEGHLLAQAGTGTGKSFAGLIPAIYHALETGKPVIVSTATKALQHQYEKDLDFLTQHLGVDFGWALVKGRGNYLCRAKLAEAEPASVFNLTQLTEELETPGHQGDIEDLVTEIDPRDRPKLTSTSDECPGASDCPFSDGCYAERAKQRARSADVILVNHAFLATDLLIRSFATDDAGDPVGILPEFGEVLIDEAHELSDYVTSMLGNEFSQRGLTAFASEVLNFVGKDEAAAVGQVNGAAMSLFRALTDYLKRESTKPLGFTQIMEMEGQFTGLVQSLQNAQELIKAVDTTGDDKRRIRRRRLMKRAASILGRFTSIIDADPAELIRWVERDTRRDDVRLKYAPLSVANFLREVLWSSHGGVLLSATLSIGGDFSFVAGQLGLDDYRSFDAGSPFNYPEQAALFVPTGFDPSPANSGRWRVQVWESTKKLILAAGGGALLLFTSASAMDAAYDAVAPALRAKGITVLKQGDQPNKALAAAFKADRDSVLFGLKSFATGFDVQGDALRLMILDKMPFTPPDDVIFKARCEAINKAENDRWASFKKLAIPMMALTLMQASGRLIRSKTDRGMIVILDSRLHSKKVDQVNGKPYGPEIMRALPNGRRIQDINAAEAYLRGIAPAKG